MSLSITGSQFDNYGTVFGIKEQRQRLSLCLNDWTGLCRRSNRYRSLHFERWAEFARSAPNPAEIVDWL